MKKYRLLSFLLWVSLWSSITCSLWGQGYPRIIEPSRRAQAEREVEELLSRMTLEEQVGQLIIPVIYPSSSETAIQRAKAELKASYAGGILYQKGEAYDQWVMNRALQREMRIPLLITADAEWGLAMRLSNTIRYPRNMALANVTEESLLYAFGVSMAQQCKVIGVHANFAPVLDINNNPRNPVIGTRSFGEDKTTVIRYGLAYSEGLEHGGVLSVAKHFPGHGNTSVDSHHALPTIIGKKKDLEELELAPFTSYFNRGFGGVMVGHLNVPSMDKSGTPASMSKKITTTLLQEKMGFKGLIFTDGMQMKGMQQKGMHPISVRAFLAGNDFLLGPINAATTHKELLQAVQTGVIDKKEVENRCRKILLYKWYLMGGSLKPLDVPTWTQEEFYTQLNTPEARTLANELWWQSIKIVRGENVLLPLSRKSKRSYGVVDIYASAQAPKEFGKTLRKIGVPITKQLQLSAKATLPDQNKNLDELAKCDVVFVNCFVGKGSPHSAFIAQIAERTQVVFTLFTSPYALSHWQSTLSQIQGVACAYEANEEAQRAVVGRYFNIDPNDVEIVQTPPKEVRKGATTSPVSQGDSRVVSTTEISTRNFASLERIVQQSIRERVFPGCQIVVLHKGKSVYNNAFGTTEGTLSSTSVGKNTIYDVASITKALTTTPIVMQLVAQGVLKLSDRVDKYIPEVKNTPVARITLKELLLHQSGLIPTINFYVDLLNPSSYEGFPLFSYRSKSGWKQIARNTWVNPAIQYDESKVAEEKSREFSIPFGNHLYLRNSFKEEMLEKIAMTPLKSRNTYRYSDVGFILVGVMAERATGKSLEQLAQELLYEPMELHSLGYLPLKRFSELEIAPTQEQCFLRGKVWGTVDDETAACRGGVAGNAGLFATATELAEVAQMILDNGSYHQQQIIPSSVVRQFRSTRGVGGRRSLGFEIGRPGVNIPEVASLQTFGHSGFTGCVVWIDPSNELVFVFLSNRTYPTRLNNKLISQKTRLTLLESTYEALGIIS
ncbi:glycoside hydrolase family 3 N-terminal domain-containing protein [Porphyromonas gingivicanis]|uniref:glycoside hydrolase family 3 N-terminal domain-containing protein n=1 Tax=Porphyromonas gingivicanis TaxID=266762 RepID=UPI00068CC2C9|nr:glycoside hydrolase family 3 N-terminal domain-containing protein [Porphyromonas gingivicanis]